MYQVIIVIHVLLGLGIIGLVLMQQGKGADAGAAFGAGASGSVFGAQGAASFLSRSTAILATLFFLTSLGLAVLNGHKGGAYDIMSETHDEKESLALPNVEGAKIDTSVPEEAPASEATTTQQAPVAVPAEKSAEMPKAAAEAETVTEKTAASAKEKTAQKGREKTKPVSKPKKETSKK